MDWIEIIISSLKVSYVHIYIINVLSIHFYFVYRALKSNGSIKTVIISIRLSLLACVHVFQGKNRGCIANSYS